MDAHKKAIKALEQAGYGFKRHEIYIHGSVYG